MFRRVVHRLMIPHEIGNAPGGRSPLTDFVFALTVVVLAMMPVMASDRDADSITAHASLQGEDRELRIERTHVDIVLPSADDGVIGEEAARWLDHWRTEGRDPVRRGLKRMGRYEDYIAAELAARDLPPSLRYLPL
ncbi:MAG: hypothetical protein OXN85_09970, partial [Gemmatimonadetes bacterium]|nr:hypothetical protein [Candidatus Palauibacter australiensis]